MADEIGILGIRWEELIAQTISFAFVLFVLWKLAYKPIFNMLETRREKIAEGVANADKIKAELAQTEAARQKILADAGDLANKIIAEARAAAARVSEVETQKAVSAAEQILVKAREAAAQERAATLTALKREVGRLVVQTSMTVTGSILTPADQTRLAEETQKQIV
jgi:F-type H+-transporting ATPase subunit b